MRIDVRPDAPETETICELACNLDDMTPEEIGFASAQLWDAGALDCYTIAIGMKKNRPGVMLCCLCREGEEDRFAALLFAHTTTLGVRVQPVQRRVLPRRAATVQTPLGPVRCKWAGGRCKAEYDDLVRIAQQTGGACTRSGRRSLPAWRLPEKRRHDEDGENTLF